MGREKPPSISDATDGGGASKPWRAAGIKKLYYSKYGLNGWIEYVFRFASPRLSNCSQLVKLDTTINAA